MCLTIRKEDGSILDAQVSRVKRADVGQVIYQDASFDKYGLTFSFEPGEMTNCYAVFTSKEHPEDVLEQLIDCPGLLAAYRYQHGIKGRIRRLQRAKSIKDFCLEEKYMDLEPEEKKYAIWYEKQYPGFAKRLKEKTTHFALHPKFSIIVPLYHTPLDFLDDMIQSVQKQTYENWELCLANGSPEDEELDAQVRKYMSKEPRIKYRKLEKNLGIAGNTNEALALATGSYTALLDHDDFLSPNALFEFVKAINENGDADCIYSDEDKVDQEGKLHYFPHFKSDYNPDLLHTNNYICHFFVVRRQLVEEVGGFRREFDGAQDYDFIFRCVEKAREVVHVPEILYHWRTHKASTADNPASKMYAFEAGKRAIEAHLERTGVKGTVSHTPDLGFYRVKYPVQGHPLVSIIIPNKDEKETLEKCLESIKKNTLYDNYEIIIVENNSTTDEIFDYYRKISEDPRIHLICWKKEFNYSAINNFGVKNARGEYLLFLNNDVTVITEDWMGEMLGVCQRKEVGAVGVKLIYPDNTIQHAGCVIGIGGIAGHMFVDMPADRTGYLHKASIFTGYERCNCSLYDDEAQCF